MKNKLLLFSMILMAIVAIGAVSACEDTNTTDVASSHAMDSDLIQDADDGDDDVVADEEEDDSDNEDEEDEEEEEYTDVEIDLEDEEIFEIGAEDYIDVGLPKGTKGTLTLKINGTSAGLKYDEDEDVIYAFLTGNYKKSLQLPLSDDEDETDYYISLDKLSPGVYNVTVTFTTSKAYNANSLIKLVPEGYAPEPETVEMELEDTYICGKSTNEILITSPKKYISSLEVKINGKFYKPVKKSDTEAVLNISSLPVGEYNVTVFYDNGLGQTDEETFIVVDKIDCPLQFVYGDKGAYVSLILNNAQGKLRVFADNLLIGESSFVNGIAKVPLSSLNAGYHTIDASYTGEDFDIDDLSEDIEILPKITVPTSMTVGDDKYLIIELGNAGGVLVVEEDGEEFFNSEIYGTGKVSLANLEDGDVSLTVRFTSSDGLDYDNDFEIDVKEVPPKIIGFKDIKMTYTDSATIKFRVYGTNGRPVEDEEFVEIKIGKKEYEAYTDKDGYVTFKIPKDVAPGKYVISAEYETVKVKKKLTINHFLKFKKVSVKRSAKKLVLKATLKKKLNKKTVKFKFNGKSYSVKTKKGVAKLVIKSTVLQKLKVGKKVKYQASYSKDKIKYSVKVKS